MFHSYDLTLFADIYVDLQTYAFKILELLSVTINEAFNINIGAFGDYTVSSVAFGLGIIFVFGAWITNLIIPN